MAKDWIWTGASESESTVIQSVRAVAVYTNPAGDIVIRQEGSGHGDNPGDDVVVVPRSFINQLVKAIKAEASKPFDPTE